MSRPKARVPGRRARILALANESARMMRATMIAAGQGEPGPGFGRLNPHSLEQTLRDNLDRLLSVGPRLSATSFQEIEASSEAELFGLVVEDFAAGAMGCLAAVVLLLEDSPLPSDFLRPVRVQVQGNA